MKILLFSEWFSDKMGYSENCLPKALAALGHDVHLITTNTQIYFDNPNYEVTYKKFLGPGIVEYGEKRLDGYTLHRLPYYRIGSRIGVKGLFAKILQIRPDIVQTFDVHTSTSFLFSLYRPFFNYKLFLEAHVHASVVKEDSRRSNWRAIIKNHGSNIVGRLISSQASLCYPISIDAAKVAEKYFGIAPKIMKVVSLGVDTEVFFPLAEDEASISNRNNLRRTLGFNNNDIVVVYTGRLSEDKNPLCLAQAIDLLKTTELNFRGLFIGEGPQLSLIKEIEGCEVLPFMPSVDLADYYRASDVGVWPKQESTSQLDAVCCGLPIIISDHTNLPERIDGNGFLYRENDPRNLSEKLLMLRNKDFRQQLGINGAKRIKSGYSWNQLAKDRIKDYEQGLM